MLIDANVLLRALDGPEHPQHDQAKAWVQQALADGERPRVHPVTMMEVSYVLGSDPAGYGWEREPIAQALGAILDDPTLVVLDRSNLERAVELYRQHPQLDLPDCYLAALAVAGGERICSFDAALTACGQPAVPSERPSRRG